MANSNKDLKFNKDAYVKLGKLLMLAESALLEAQMLSGHMMTLKEMKTLDKAVNTVNYFRSDAENIMARNGMERDCVSTFWGGVLEDSVKRLTLEEITKK